mgnify:CR=1 FL=1
MARAASLNRTSVGLKQNRARGLPKALGLPQSNQRGIETVVDVSQSSHILSASIEPAWD